METDIQAMISECKRQEESCLYTSTTFFEWLKELRRWRVAFVVTPIVLGGIAGWQVLTKDADFAWFTGGCALLAGITPALYKALDFDVDLQSLGKRGHEFKVLQDRFRQAWSVQALGDLVAFKDEFGKLMDRMDKAREGSLTPPERFFRAAQKKIARGDYNFQ